MGSSMAQPVQQLKNQNDCATMSASVTGVFLPVGDLADMERLLMSLLKKYRKMQGKDERLLTVEQWRRANR